MNRALPNSRYRKAGLGRVFLLYRPGVLIGVLLLSTVTLVGAVAATVIGSTQTPILAVLSWVSGTGEGELLSIIIGQLRLPRILLALLCGAALGAAGVAMQSTTRNGLADPGLIGIKEGTVITVVAIMLFFPQMSAFWRPLFGILGGAIVAITVIAIARSLSGLRFVLIGIGVSWLLSSAIALFMTMARIEEVQTAMIWLGGSLHAGSWLDLRLAFPWVLIGLTILLATTRSADAALLGDMVSVGLGARLQRLNLARLSASVLLTSACASVVGGLGFVGLMAPHLARLCFGQSQMPLLVGSASIGSLLVLVADTLGRVAFAPIQIPAGILIAVLGLPFFLALMWQRKDSL